MKKSLWIVMAALSGLPIAVQASCESVKAEINQKIINNGVPASGFTLSIVPSDQADQTGGQVVGHCENDTHKIVYKHITSETENTPADTGSSEDAPSP
ncbi:DUF1161 domain-containing protein [Enterobacteriaceae bacterium LUAb1]